MLKSTRLGIYLSLGETFTCAILPAHAAMRERRLSAILEIRGNPILLSSNSAGPFGSLPNRIEPAVVGLCAAALAHRPGVLFAQGRRVVPVQRSGTGARAQPRFVDGIRLSKLRDFLSDRLGQR